MRAIAPLLMMAALGVCAGDVRAATVLHVATDGDDGGPGTRDRPFRTLVRARDAVRSAVADGMTEDATVLVHSGLHCLSAPLALDERDSGRDGHRVIYRGAPGGETRIAAGRLLTGWRRVDADVYAVDLRDGWRPNWLSEDGALAVMARTPNEGYLAVDSTSGEPVDPTLTWAEGDLPRRFGFSKAQALVWCGYNEQWDGGKNYNWEASLLPIADADSDTRTMTLRGRSIRTMHAHNRYYVRGAREFLDAAGEFHVDDEAGVLYYHPRRTPIEGREILASTTPRVIEIIGASRAAPARGITIEGLTIELSQAPDEFGPSQYLVCDGMIYLRNAEDCVVRRCRLRNAGLAAVALDRENVGHTVADNLIEDCGYSGVCLSGHWVGAQVYSSEVEAHVNHRHLVTNNHVRNCGRLIGQASGVWLYETGENEISQNLIEGMPRYGVRIDGTSFDGLVRPKSEGGAIGGELYGRRIAFGSHLDFLHSRNNRIVFNEIRDCMRDSQDGGAITTYGTGAGNVIANNLVHDIRSAVSEGSHAGIYLDDASNLFTVEKNIVARIVGSDHIFPLIVKGYDNVVRNNIVADCEARAAIYILQTPHGGLPEEQGHKEELVDRLRFSRNILYRNAGLVYMIFPWSDSIVAESDYNVIHRPSQPLHCAIDWDWQPWEAWTGYFGGRYERHTRLADPLFRDPDGLDFSLADDSPALAVGFEPIDVSAIGLRASRAF